MSNEQNIFTPDHSCPPTPKNLKCDENILTPERPKPLNSPWSPIADDACPICLGRISDKCAAETCFHNFCFVCLKEWAKQKPVCPLCKQAFTNILYDIKSEVEYKVWKVPRPDPVQEIRNSVEEIRNLHVSLQEFFMNENRPFFSFRTTRFLHRLRLRNARSSLDSLPNGPRETRSRHVLQPPMSRINVYLNNVWVIPMADITGRFRETSPELYREQAALTHRLIPWVNRELAALLEPSRVGELLTLIMSLIERYPINSNEFSNSIKPYFGRRTDHFVHEFYNFARSPYDMVGHDNASQYLPRYELNGSDSSDSDAVIEVDSSGAPVEHSSQPSNFENSEDVLSPNVFLLSTDDEFTDSNNAADILSSESHNPEPPESVLRDLITRTCDFFSSHYSSEPGPSNINNSNDTEHSRDINEPGPSGINTATVKHENCTADSDSDDCLMVEELKPKGQRTPLLIELSSDDGYDHVSSKKKLKLQDDNSKPKKCKKPNLDRVSFSDFYTMKTEGKGLQKRDHDYCVGNNQENSNTSSYSTCVNYSETEDEYGSLHFSIGHRSTSHKHSVHRSSTSSNDTGECSRSLHRRHSFYSKDKRGKCHFSKTKAKFKSKSERKLHSLKRNNYQSDTSSSGSDKWHLSEEEFVKSYKFRYNRRPYYRISSSSSLDEDAKIKRKNHKKRKSSKRDKKRKKRKHKSSDS